MRRVVPELGRRLDFCASRNVSADAVPELSRQTQNPESPAERERNCVNDDWTRFVCYSAL